MKGMFILLAGSSRLFYCVSANDHIASLRDCSSSEYTRVALSDVTHISLVSEDLLSIIKERS